MPKRFDIVVVDGYSTKEVEATHGAYVQAEDFVKLEQRYRELISCVQDDLAQDFGLDE